MTNTTQPRSVHGHELRHLLAEAGRPVSADELRQLAVERFGDGAVFHTCCQQNLSLAETLEFFVSRKKIVLRDGLYSVESGHDCGGHGHGHRHDHVHHD